MLCVFAQNHESERDALYNITISLSLMVLRKNVTHSGYMGRHSNNNFYYLFYFILFFFIFIFYYYLSSPFYFSVCKKWKYLSQNSWRKYNSLDFLKKTWGVKHILFVDSLKQNINFDKAINLCGRYVTNVSSDLITFSKICYFLPCAKELQIVDICVQPPGKCHIEPELDSYPQYRRNIFEIHQQCSYPFWFIVYRWLLSHAKNITSFQIKFSHTYYKEFQLYTLLYEMKYLKLFHLHRCDFLMCRGEFLLHLPFDTIEEINLSSNESLPFDNNILSSVSIFS